MRRILMLGAAFFLLSTATSVAQDAAERAMGAEHTQKDISAGRAQGAPEGDQLARPVAPGSQQAARGEKQPAYDPTTGVQGTASTNAGGSLQAAEQDATREPTVQRPLSQPQQQQGQ